MYRLLRTFWGLAAVGGAIAVGITTHDAGFTAITFVGGLIVPRMLGLAGPGPLGRARRLAMGPAGGGGFGPGGWQGGCSGGGRGGWRSQRWEDWHRQAHEAAPAAPPVQAA